MHWCWKEQIHQVYNNFNMVWTVLCTFSIYLVQKYSYIHDYLIIILFTFKLQCKMLKLCKLWHTTLVHFCCFFIYRYLCSCFESVKTTTFKLIWILKANDLAECNNYLFYLSQITRGKNTCKMVVVFLIMQEGH